MYLVLCIYPPPQSRYRIVSFLKVSLVLENNAFKIFICIPPWGIRPKEPKARSGGDACIQSSSIHNSQEAEGTQVSTDA